MTTRERECLWSIVCAYRVYMAQRGVMIRPLGYASALWDAAYGR